MNDPISISSGALMLLGSSPIQSFDDSTVESLAAKTLYKTVYEQLLAYRQWSFARSTVKLQRLGEDSIYDFKYVYRMPTDVVHISSLVSGMDYQVSVDRKVHTDCEVCSINCTVKPDESLLPSDFVLAFTYILAAHMCPMVTDNDAQADRYETRGAKYLQIASNNDAVKSPMKYKTYSPLLAWHN